MEIDLITKTEFTYTNIVDSLDLKHQLSWAELTDFQRQCFVKRAIRLTVKAAILRKHNCAIDKQIKQFLDNFEEAVIQVNK